jgi:hypothetical protein
VADDFIRLIPTDPNWQPADAAAAAVAAYGFELFAGPHDSIDEVTYVFFEAVTLIDAGTNTANANWPRCGDHIDLD